jgi:hypothetical protein
MYQDDVIRIMCPNLGCQRILAVPSRARGQVVRCRGCRTNIRVPSEQGEDDAARGSRRSDASERAA